MKRLFFFTFAAFIHLTMQAQPILTADYNVVPLPRQIAPDKGQPFVMDAHTAIVFPTSDTELERLAGFLSTYINEQTSLRIPLQSREKKSTKGTISLMLKTGKEPTDSEAYEISIRKDGIVLSGATPAALFRAMQTFRKSLPVATEAQQILLPPATIADSPALSYRGMHLDCARHFFPVEFVKQYLDMMALHGMNRFHWHLTDDQGWRVEIKAYPRLTEIGSQRSSTVVGRNSDVQDGVPHGGFYTQEELREIVQYAAERYIEVVPEIDMPGHMLAAMAAYPELGCTGGPYEVGQYWGIYPDILCAGKPQTYEFVEGVLDEICDIFPCEYIHIGGDEAPKQRWKECPRCQQKMADEALYATKDTPAEELLQGYFTTFVQQYLAGKGRKIIGWDELLGCDVDQSATIMSWRGGNNTLNAARLGHDVIVVPNKNLYFDFYQTAETWNEPLLIGGCSTVEDVYNLQLIPEGLTAAERQHILGFQANLWTEYIGSPSLAEYQVLPRMAALAELQWNNGRQTSYEAFLRRLDTFRRIYECYGWNYARHLWPEEYRRTAKTFG
mgnify:CR=1 FL=1